MNDGNEKKLKDTSDDEIKLAGLEELVPEELETHLVLHSNRLRTFVDARLEILTYVEAMFGLRIRDSTPIESRTRRHDDPMDVDAISFLASGTGKGKRISKSTRLLFQMRSWPLSERLHYSCRPAHWQWQERQSVQAMVQECWQRKGAKKVREMENPNSKIQRFQECQMFVQG